MPRHLLIIDILPACIGNILWVNVTILQNVRPQRVNSTSTVLQQFIKRASTEHQQFSMLHHWLSEGSATAVAHNPSIACLYTQYGSSWCPYTYNERLQSINDFEYCILYIRRAVRRHLSVIEVWPACMGDILTVDVATPQTCASTVSQQHVNRESKEHQQSINRASTSFSVASCKIQRLCHRICP